MIKHIYKLPWFPIAIILTILILIKLVSRDGIVNFMTNDRWADEVDKISSKLDVLKYLISTCVWLSILIYFIK